MPAYYLPHLVNVDEEDEPHLIRKLFLLFLKKEVEKLSHSNAHILEFECFLCRRVEQRCGSLKSGTFLATHKVVIPRSTKVNFLINSILLIHISAGSMGGVVLRQDGRTAGDG